MRVGGYWGKEILESIRAKLPDVKTEFVVEEFVLVEHPDGGYIFREKGQRERYVKKLDALTIEYTNDPKEAERFELKEERIE